MAIRHMTEREWRGINLQAPCLIPFDLDDVKMLQFVLRRIKQILGAHPTVISTGVGYLIILRLKEFILEQIFDPFAHLQPSNLFLGWSERFLSWGLTDPSHHATFTSCMLKISGTLNSKNNAQVKVIQRWNGEFSSVSPLLEPFLDYLAELESKRVTFSWSGMRDKMRTDWIENLLQTPVKTRRGTACERIFCPYLMNILGWRKEEAFKVVRGWLDKCDTVKRLAPKMRGSWYVNYYLQWAFDHKYHPLKLETLRTDHSYLYNIVVSQEIARKTNSSVSMS